MHLLQLVFADLYGAMRSNEHYWAPQSPIWDAAWGWPELYLSQNMGLLYGGALAIAVVLAFGLVRGLAWAREIRFFSIAAVLVLLYTLGGYTPAFRLMYELLPGYRFFGAPQMEASSSAHSLRCSRGIWCIVGSRARCHRRRAPVRPRYGLCALLVGAALLLAHSVVGVGPALRSDPDRRSFHLRGHRGAG